MIYVEVSDIKLDLFDFKLLDGELLKDGDGERVVHVLITYQDEITQWFKTSLHTIPEVPSTFKDGVLQYEIPFESEDDAIMFALRFGGTIIENKC